VLTGLPGSGKSGVAHILAPRLRGDWEILHWDDTIGPTQLVYQDEGKVDGQLEWERLRPYHPLVAGWSAGWHLFDGRNVLLEGHVLNGSERSRLLNAVQALYRGPLDTRFALLDVPVERAIKNRIGDTYWHPEWVGEERRRNVDGWIRSHAPTPDSYDSKIDGVADDFFEVVRRVIVYFGLDLKPGFGLA